MQIEAVGWWEQSKLGRQFIDALRLRIDGASIEATGSDIVGPFQLSKHFSDGGAVEIHKSYRAAHQVLYAGTFDGEGRLDGQWQLNGMWGKWSMRFVASISTAEINEIS